MTAPTLSVRARQVEDHQRQLSGRTVLRAMVRWGWQAAPRQFVLSLVLFFASTICLMFFPVGLAIIVDAAIGRHAGQIGYGVAVLALSFTLNWLLTMRVITEGTALCDRTTMHVTAHIAALVNGAPGVEHFERPEYLNELDMIEQNRLQFGIWPRHALYVIQLAMYTVGVIVVLAVIYPPLALLPLCIIAPVVGERVALRMRERADRELAADRRFAARMFTVVTSESSARELRLFGAVGAMRDRHRRVVREIRRRSDGAALRGGALQLTGWLVFAAGFMAAVVLIVHRASRGEATLGQVVLVATLVLRAQTLIIPAAQGVERLLSAGRTARRILWLEEYARAGSGPRIPEAAGVCRTPTEDWPAARVPERLERGITLRGVRFGYAGSTAPVLDGVDLHLRAGSAVALIGENGAGKSTLIKLLTGMYEPDEGAILVDGVPLDAMDLAAWRARTSAVFQDFLRLELVARQSVGVGDLPRIDDAGALDAAVGRADAREVVRSLPQGLDTPLGRSFTGGSELSGGQWQRIALARGMMRDAPLLLVLDEPTASLDPVAEAELFERYVEAYRSAAERVGAITLLVSHRFSTVRMADQIVVLDGGRIVESGDHAALHAAGGRYAELYDLQAQSYR